MLLLKCSCGCHFTVKNDILSKGRRLKCQNCEQSAMFTGFNDLNDLKGILEESGFKLYSIPDDAVIDYHFDIND